MLDLVRTFTWQVTLWPQPAICLNKCFTANSIMEVNACLKALSNTLCMPTQSGKERTDKIQELNCCYLPSSRYPSSLNVRRHQRHAGMWPIAWLLLKGFESPKFFLNKGSGQLAWWQVRQQAASVAASTRQIMCQSLGLKPWLAAGFCPPCLQATWRLRIVRPLFLGQARSLSA